MAEETQTMKKRIINISTILICLFIIIFVVIPHHAITEKQAMKLAVDYYSFRSENDAVKDIKVERKYSNFTAKESSGILSNIWDYWNPDFRCYVVTVTVLNNDVNGHIMLYVDAYTGYVDDASEGIRWKRGREEYYDGK